jgi:pimeloyl-ACP methyl ester carboxylesterase
MMGVPRGMTPPAPSKISSTDRIRSYSHDGLRFDVSDTGPTNGPIVVLLHGFPQRATCWRRVSRLLNERGFRTLAPDQRGYSPGARPRTRGAYRMSHLVADVEALLELSARPVQLVGHDWGAVLAWTVAARNPGLLSSLVTVSAPHPRAYSRALMASDQAARSGYAVAFQLPLLPEMLASAAPALVEAGLRRSGMAEDAIRRFRREIVDDGAFGPALGWYRAVPLSGPGRPPAPIRVATTHVWSDGDVALSRKGAELSGDYVEAPYRLEVLNGVSHWVPEEAPERLADLIEERSSVRPRS